MMGLRTRARNRRETDRDSGHRAVEELVDSLIANHGGDSLLCGRVLGDARAGYWHGFTTLNSINSRAFLVAAHASLDAYDRVLRTAKQMEADGERAFVPLLIDLKRRVTEARVPAPARTTVGATR